MAISLTKLPWYAQIAAFMALAVGGIGAFYYYYAMPAQEGMVGRRNQLISLQKDIATGLATAKKLPEFEAQAGDLEGRLDSLRAVLPEEKDAADLLRRMQTVATQSNLVIRSFAPKAVVTQSLHAEWPIALELDGTYHNLAIFFDRVGKFTRIVNISGLEVIGKATPTPNSTISAKCTATTFVLLDKPIPPKPGAAKPGTAATPPRPKV
jgi:type IV pilus assembly protein PilO